MLGLKQGAAATLATEISEVRRDVAGLKKELREFRRDHMQEHNRERADRIKTRRWVIGSIIGVLALVEPPLLILLAHVR